MSWLAFELLLLALGWLGVAFFKGYIQQKEYEPKVSKGGGFIFALLWFGLLSVLVYQKIILSFYLWLFGPLVFISLIGFLEDHQKISSRVRLIFQVMALYTSYYFINLDITHLNLMGLNIGSLALHKIPEWSFLSFIVLGIVGLGSVWDRMDKSDGFAAVQSLFILGLTGFILSLAGAYSLAILVFGLCPLLGGFLIWNWPVAKIVMGKSGTTFLGGFIAVVALFSYQFYNIPLEIWLILMAPFLVDATLTAIRRCLALVLLPPHYIGTKENHAYQRLLNIGWTPSQLLCGLIALNSLLATLVWWAYNTPAFLMQVTAASFAIVLVVYGFIEYTKPMYRSWYRTVPKKLGPEPL